MTFELNDILIDEIAFSMEDQNDTFFVDAKNSKVVQSDAVEDCSPEEGGERYYEIPHWSSGDGYEMLEKFTASLHHPFAYSELRLILSSGRGVFRGFKNVLKAYPEVEKKFFLFKDKTLKDKIASWYNDLREDWGLERLPDEIREIDLVDEDFQFSAFDVKKDFESVKYGEKLLAQEIMTDFQGEAGEAAIEIYNRECKKEDTSELTGIVCRSVTDDFSGCILAVPMPSNAKHTVFMTDFFVLKNYRGLGIAEKLLERFLLKLKSDGKTRVFVPYQIIPQTIIPMLQRSGFESSYFGFAAQL